MIGLTWPFVVVGFHPVDRTDHKDQVIRTEHNVEERVLYFLELLSLSVS